MSEPTKIVKAAKATIRSSGGPRTETGKSKSRQNATKHGIFSEIVVLPNESREEYQALLEDLQESQQPEGRLEELLVEKLASLAWRHRRLLVAESAEIQQGSQFVEWDWQNGEKQKAEIMLSNMANSLNTNTGFIAGIYNPEILASCLQSLQELRKDIESSGLFRDRDTEVLKKIYGSPRPLSKTLFYDYLIWTNTAEASEEGRNCEGYATPEQCRKNILSEIDQEISRLRKYQGERALIESARAKLQVLQRTVPESERLDRLLRYETSLERSFDRTLNQLERIQRLRRGQPVAPQIDVTVSR